MPSNSPLEGWYRRVLLDRQFITDEDLRRANYLQDAAGKAGKPEPNLLEILLDQGFITRGQVKRVHREASEKMAEGGGPLHIPGYQLTDKLGQGGMSIVYKAIQLSLERAVAIKVLPKKLAADRTVVDRFTREARAAAKVTHPNIVQAVDLGQEPGGYHYFVMEFVEGQTAWDELSRIGRYTEVDALRLGLQIGRALAHLHTRGIVHRDVKPHNIMVTADRTAKLMDMGLAAETTEAGTVARERGPIMGTAYYMSPEQIRGGGDVDFHTDVYSLGATLYHMTTGIVPFEGGDPNEVVGRQLNEVLTPPYIVHPDVSVEISNLVGKAMAKEADERHDSMTEMVEEMERILGSRTTA